MTGKLFTFHATTYAPEVHHRAHAHEELHLSLMLRGAVREAVGGRVVHGRTLGVVSKDPGVVHTDTFGREGALIARLSIPQCRLADVSDHPHRERPWQWSHDLSVSAAFLRVVQRACERPGAISVQDDDVVDVIAGLSAPSSTRRVFASRTVTGRTTAPPVWLREVWTFLREEWSSTLSATDVATRAGVHPVYLSRCLRRWYGTTTSEALRAMRVAVAANALAGSRRSVSSVAQTAGFADEPHLSRTVRRMLSITPREYRQLAARVAGQPPRVK